MRSSSILSNHITSLLLIYETDISFLPISVSNVHCAWCLPVTTTSTDRINSFVEAPS